MGGIAPIPHSAIRRYGIEAGLAGLALRIFERMIRAMDNAEIEDAIDANKAKGRNDRIARARTRMRGRSR